MVTQRITFLAVLAFSLQVPPSLVDTARRNGGTAVLNIDFNSPIGELRDLTAKSAVIVRGIVRVVTTRLADDESKVMTEYKIVPNKFYKGSFAGPTTRPGMTAPLIAQHAGGTLEFDNLHLQTVVDELPEKETLSKGEEVVLFLSAVDPGRFQLTGGPFGAFRVADGSVTAMTKSAARRRHDKPMTIGEFEQELHRRLPK